MNVYYEEDRRPKWLYQFENSALLDIAKMGVFDFLCRDCRLAPAQVELVYGMYSGCRAGPKTAPLTAIRRGDQTDCKR